MRFKEQLVARPGDEAKTPAEKKVLILSWLKKNNFHNCIVNDDGEVDSPTSIDLGMMRFKASSYANFMTFAACSPLGPLTISNWTFSPSFKLL